MDTRLSVQAVELPREGQSPLLVYDLMVGDHVVHAGVFDPQEQSALAEGIAAERGATHAVSHDG